MGELYITEWIISFKYYKFHHFYLSVCKQGNLPKVGSQNLYSRLIYSIRSWSMILY